MPVSSDNRARRLLVITYHFPPDGSVGGLRWDGLSKYLARRGWEVHIITAAEGVDASRADGVHVHHCPPSRTLNDMYNVAAARARAFRRSRAVEGRLPPAQAWEPAPTASPRKRGLLGWLRTNVSAALVFPDYAQGWILPSSRLARRLLRAHAFDAVVSSGPPHSAHLAGTLACWSTPKLLLVDMRDPWAALIDMSWSHPVFSSAATRGLVRRLERLVFRRGRRVVTNTPEFADTLRARYPGLQVTFVPNGVDRERLPPAPPSRFDGLSLAYAGTLYLGRDLSPIVRAMGALLERRPEARGFIKLRVAGSMTTTLASRFQDEVAAAHLEDMVEVRGRVSPTEAMDMINRSHLSLVLAQNQPSQIPAKLYECVAMGIPTLVVAEATSAAAREARRVGALALEETDVEGMTQLLETLWLDREARCVPCEAIGYDSIAGRMEAVLMSALPG